MPMNGKRGIFARTLITALIAVLIPVVFYSENSLARNENQLVFAISLPPSLLGDGAADIISYFNKLKKSVSQKTGYELIVDTYATPDQAITALKRDNADAAWVPVFSYGKYRASEKNNAVLPLAALSINGAKKSVTCLYVRKDSGIRDLDKLVAKQIAFADPSSWVMLNLIFEAEKYPIHPYDFFSTHEELTRESQSYALHLKQVDAILLEPSYIPFIEKNIQGFRNEIYTIGCAPPMSNTLLIYRSNMRAQKRKNILSMLTTMHKDPLFSEILPFFKQGNAKWVEATPGLYDDWAALYSKAVRKGWIAQYNNIHRGRSE